MNIIVAMNKEYSIGLNGKLMYHIPQDMRYFADKTIGNTVVMGRKTLVSLPKGKALPNRINIVISRTMTQQEAQDCGVYLVSCIDELFKFLKQKNINTNSVYIIGGGEIYSLFLPLCDTMYITEVETTDKGDVYFPKFNKNEWVKIIGEENQHNGITFKFNIYKRIV